MAQHCWKNVAHVSAVYTSPWFYLWVVHFPWAHKQSTLPAALPLTPGCVSLWSVRTKVHCHSLLLWHLFAATTHSCVPVLLCDLQKPREQTPEWFSRWVFSLSPKHDLFCVNTGQMSCVVPCFEKCFPTPVGQYVVLLPISLVSC